MKKIKFYHVCALLILISGVFVYSQEENRVDRVTVPLSDPSRPGLVEASVHSGGITVKGYEGTEVLVEAKTRGKLLRETRKPRKKAEGMSRIQIAGGTGLTIEEQNNKIEVSVSSLRQTVDLVIQVPYETSLDLSSHNNGDILVENVHGEIEVNNHNGKLTLTSISGSVVAHTFNGEVNVTFTSVDPEKPMSFSTWNGDIDVTFPADIAADVKMKSDRGDIYSDFDISIKEVPQKVEKTPEKEGGKYRISFEKHIYGAINGGGPEYQFKNYNGDILIRRAK